jgi:hypothetical protein
MGLLNLLKSIFSPEVALSEPDATLDDIDALHKALEETNRDGAFVVFMPGPPRAGESDVLNIQFSQENGNIGLDWVLISSVNIDEKDKFLEICRSHNVQVKERNENGCEYLRVEEGDMVSLCKNAITSLYPGLQGKCLDLVVEGFDWPVNV